VQVDFEVTEESLADQLFQLGQNDFLVKRLHLRIVAAAVRDFATQHTLLVLSQQQGVVAFFFEGESRRRKRRRSRRRRSGSSGIGLSSLKLPSR